MNISIIKHIVKQHLPDIMVGVGIAGTAIATVMTCKATLHLEEELDRLERHTNEIKAVPEEEGIDTRKELTKAYIKGTFRIVKLYLPSAAVYAMSIGSILFGHDMLRTENVALMALVCERDELHNLYRRRVAERFGEEIEKELCYDIGREDIEYIEETKDGKEKKRTKKNAPIAGDIIGHPYAKKFDGRCINWRQSPERNLYFLRMMQAEANDACQARGHIFLNEVYDMLGFPRTEDGQYVGWIRGDKDIDFGIYTVFSRENNEFINGYSPIAILDFNVDGIISDKIEGLIV